MGTVNNSRSTSTHPPHLDPLAIREQIERMIAHRLFNRSKRYSAFLRYVTEYALSASPEHLKERTLGIEVFGRKPDYDTNQDPVVRITAGDVRLRIAQYYHEPGHETEIRIELPAGSYVPEFRPPASGNSLGFPVFRRPRRLNFYTLGLVAAVAIAVTCLAALTLLPAAHKKDANEFWRPVLSSQSPLLIVVPGCFGQTYTREPSATFALPPRGSEQERSSPCNNGMGNLPFADALAMSRITGISKSRGESYEVRQASLVSFSDVQDQPVVLIGACDNVWTMRLVSALPYTMSFNGDANLDQIVAKRNPSERWTIPFHWQSGDLKKDYAIVARVNDPRTLHWVVIAAGLGTYGTEAAGEFLNDPRYMQDLISRAPAGWAQGNLEAVLETDVIDGSSGPPKILAARFW